MKIFAAVLIVLVVVTGILGPQLFFVVDETQLAVVTRFGEVRSEITKPGLYVKTPFVDSVNYFDARRTLFDAPPDALLTSDKKRLVIDAYAIGRIEDPLAFFRTLRTQAQANTRVVDLIGSNLREEIANDEQEEIIKIRREAIMNEVRDALAPELTPFGVTILDVRIKRADFPVEIATSVYERMKAERKRIADAERADGAKQDLEIRAGADREATIIRAEAERDANLVRGDGEAEAISIFAEALQQDPEFYAFQRTLESYKTFLTTNTTMVLPADSELFQFLQSPGEATPASQDGESSP